MLKTSSATKDATGSDLFIQQGDFVIKNLSAINERMEAYQLRRRIFCQELNWVPQLKNAIEKDEYDNSAVFFGVVNKKNELLAFLRLIMPHSFFMIEKEFSSLVSLDHRVRKENDTAEISRLCVAPEARNVSILDNFGFINISMLLFKGLYHWCNKNNVRYLYAVAEDKVYKLFRSKGFPFRPIGAPSRMPDGVKALAVIMDWREFEIQNTTTRPKLLEWFTLYQATLPELQLQQPATSSRHPA